MNDLVRATERDFKGVYIPKEIWCNRELTANMKLVWGEIFGLDNDFGCIAENEHFAEMFGWFVKGDVNAPDVRKVQRLIKGLKELGHVDVELDKAKNSRTIRIVGKYRHLDSKSMGDLAQLRRELVLKKRM
jgi:hypothetical protein